MIMSDEHKYVFVELPWTGSTAISRELREHYGGRGVLHKHCNYREFLKYASAEQRRYYVFSGIRNPLDALVSLYVKLVTDHRRNYSRNKDWVRRRDIRQYRWIQENKPSFAEFFLRFYHLPYENWSSLDHHRFDYVYRLENVQDDFAEILRRIGLSQVRPLPVVHPTTGKGPSWQEHYGPETRKRALFVCGPLMERWGYEFPEEWGVGRVQLTARSLYKTIALGKNAARRLRPTDHHAPDRLP